MRFRIGAALVALALLTCAAPATSAGGLAKYEIVPGESIGYAALGMTRKTIQHKLKSPIAPQRSQAGQFYSLTYRYPYKGCPVEPGGKLIIVFKGVSRGAHAVYMLTVEPCLGTRPEHIGVGDTFSEMKGSYPGTDCYHSNPDGTRNHTIESTDNFECELHRNGGFTYFSFASQDSDPGQHIGGIAIATRRVD